MAMLAPKLLSLLVALNIASALGQTCQQGVGPDALYTACSFTVGTSTFEVPIGVSTLAYSVTGGQGGTITNLQILTGPSASLQGYLDLPSGPTTLSIIVASAGGSGGAQVQSIGGSGYGKGGNGGSGAFNTGAGGGSSAVVVSGSNEVLIVAAGGGGAGFDAGASNPQALDNVEDPSMSPDGASAPNSGAGGFPDGGSGGGYRGGGGSQAAAGVSGNPGRSYYNPSYGTAPTLSSTPSSTTTPTDGNVVLTYLTPLAPSGGGGNGRQRARRLRRRNVCAHNHRVCNKLSALCVDLKTSFEHCGTCFNDCSELGDRAICNNGVCQGY